MDGRDPTYIGYTPSNTRDPADEPEFNRWYKEVHFRDVQQAGFHSWPLMFHNVLKTVPRGSDRFLIMYEFYHRDFEAARAEFTSKHMPKLRQDYDQTKGVRSPNRVQYRVLRRVFGPSEPKRSQSLLVHRINCQDPAKLDELRRWFCDIRVPEVVATGFYHTGSFGEAVQERTASTESPGGTRFLALYETAATDAGVPAAQIGKLYPEASYPACVQVVETAVFRRDSP
ncbi:MAG: hypothetical protein HYX99_00775 [Chloroflexi bacterium]|nr:hypothetical protein [Chloroflexota bacterium]